MGGLLYISLMTGRLSIPMKVREPQTREFAGLARRWTTDIRKYVVDNRQLAREQVPKQPRASRNFAIATVVSSNAQRTQSIVRGGMVDAIAPLRVRREHRIRNIT